MIRDDKDARLVIDDGNLLCPWCLSDADGFQPKSVRENLGGPNDDVVYSIEFECETHGQWTDRLWIHITRHEGRAEIRFETVKAHDQDR